MIDEVASVKYETHRVYSYMLPKETAEVDKLREEADFFTNQIYREMRRICSIDYELARTVTINLAEMNKRLSSQLMKGWKGLAEYYSS